MQLGDLKNVSTGDRKLRTSLRIYYGIYSMKYLQNMLCEVWNV